MQNVKDACNAGVEKVKGKKVDFYIYLSINTWIIWFFSEVTSGTSYEANKEAAKNENLSAGTRFSHGIDAAKDKGI